MTGSDWDDYEYFYSIGFDYKHVEFGYMIISNFFSTLGINFWFFHILFKIIALSIILKTLAYFNKNYYLPLMIFLSSFGFFLFIDCPFRNLIAMAIFLVAIYFLYIKKPLFFIAITIFASLFHLSAILLLPIYFSRYISKVSSRSLLITFVALYFFLLLDGINFLLNLIFVLLPSIYSRIDFYTDKSIFESSLFAPGLILRLICLLLILFFRKKILDSFSKGEFVFNLAYIYLILSLFTYAIPLLFRFALYLSPFYVIVIGMVINLLNNNNKIILKVFYLLASIMITWTTITGKPYYIPYTNIITYIIKGDYPDYNYRKEYNLINSPYSKKKVD